MLSITINKFRKKVYERFYRKNVVADYRSRIRNENFTIICNNCFGGYLYHDLGLQFLTPTINLMIRAEDYIKFLENLEFYLDCEITDGGIFDASYGGVIGILNNEIKINGIHYETFEELKSKWNERKKRVNFNNIFIIGSYRDGCTDELVERFCALPYKNKVFFSHKEINCDNSECVVKMKLPKSAQRVPVADTMASCKIRAYDKYFDFITWLNTINS